MEEDKKCVYCGAERPVSSQLYKRKYCGFTCSNNYKAAIEGLEGYMK